MKSINESLLTLLFFFNVDLLILEREEGGEKERETERKREKKREKDTMSLLFHLFMYSFVASCMCPEQGSNLQP